MALRRARADRSPAPARTIPSPSARTRSPRRTGPPPRAGTPGAYELFSLDSITAGGRKIIADRYYQVEAVQAICTGLADGGRGQLHAACGTGKTGMAQRAAELLCPDGGLVVIVCPSIDLVDQTLREWKDTTDGFHALAVCSDDTVHDSVATADDLPATVTTDPTAVGAWLRTPSTARLRLIVGTHMSAHVIGGALLASDTAADMLIIDEAHRTAGVVDKHTALVHDDHRFPARRRLYTTATPKVIGEKLPGQTAANSTRVVGMNDTAVFGPVLYRYRFAQAIKDGYLDDYRLVVMGVTRAEIAEYLASLPRVATGGALHTSLHTAMVQTVLAKAGRQYGFRRALAFCRRLNEAHDFARTMGATLSALPADMKPEGLLTTAFVNGGMTSFERRQRLAYLAEPPEGGWAVVTNVRCLGEGVDVPAIDCVAFTHPKRATAEIVQAIGRALRCDPNGSGVATILVPILLPDNTSVGAEGGEGPVDDSQDADRLDLSDYRLLWQVIRALRAHDETLGAEVDHRRMSDPTPYDYQQQQPLEHVVISLPPGYDDGTFLRQLTARVVTATAGSWWNNFALLRRIYDTHGHTTIPRDYTVFDETRQIRVALGSWADRMRAAHRKRQLSDDRVAALTDLGFDFHADAIDWTDGLGAATAFRDSNGHLEPVRSQRVNGIELRSWLDKQRARAQAGELGDERRAALDALGMRWRDRPKTFGEHIAALRAYRAVHGHIDIKPEAGTDDGYLGNWLVTVRIRRKMGQVSAHEIAALDELGMRWSRSPAPAASPAASAVTDTAALSTRSTGAHPPAARPAAPTEPTTEPTTGAPGEALTGRPGRRASARLLAPKLPVAPDHRAHRQPQHAAGQPAQQPAAQPEQPVWKGPRPTPGRTRRSAGDASPGTPSSTPKPPVPVFHPASDP